MWYYWSITATVTEVAETTAAAAAVAMTETAAAAISAAAVTVAAAIVALYRRNKRSNPLTAGVADGAAGTTASPPTIASKHLPHQCQANLCV